MMVRTLLPPGFRFHPTDVELVMYYLKRKVMGKKLHFEAITELNIYKFSPWDLPGTFFWVFFDIFTPSLHSLFPFHFFLILHNVQLFLQPPATLFCILMISNFI